MNYKYIAIVIFMTVLSEQYVTSVKDVIAF